VVALGIPAKLLRDPFVDNRFSEEIVRGEAQHKLDLLEDVGRLRSGGKGSVNATLASLEQAGVGGWNRRMSGDRSKRPPDNDSALAELDRVLRRFRALG
jgi:hypothetical protein